MDIVWTKIRRYARLADQAWLRGDNSTYDYFASEIDSLIREVE